VSALPGTTASQVGQQIKPAIERTDCHIQHMVALTHVHDLLHLTCRFLSLKAAGWSKPQAVAQQLRSSWNEHWWWRPSAAYVPTTLRLILCLRWFVRCFSILMRTMALATFLPCRKALLSTVTNCYFGSMPVRPSRHHCMLHPKVQQTFAIWWLQGAAVLATWQHFDRTQGAFLGGPCPLNTIAVV